MPGIVTVADDLTGAAEMAGIGVDHGLNASVARWTGVRGRAGVGLLAIDADTRSIPPAAAATRVSALLETPLQGDLFYKKTDSALCGNIVTELRALMIKLDRPVALLLAQNPSKGRTIVRGEYRIAGVPLHQTDFGLDPEHACVTADVAALLSRHGERVVCLSPGDPLPAEGIVACAAATAADVKQWAERVGPAILPAGGADFFHALLRGHGHPFNPQPVSMDGTPLLMICGSASAYSRKTVAQWSQAGEPVCEMPETLFAMPEGADARGGWVATLQESLRQKGRTILAIPQAIEPARATALRACVARVVVDVASSIQSSFNSGQPRLTLAIEGGATAAAIVEQLGWSDFKVLGNLAPGVVALMPRNAPSFRLIMKPGSYPWPVSLSFGSNSV